LADARARLAAQKKATADAAACLTDRPLEGAQIRNQEGNDNVKEEEDASRSAKGEREHAEAKLEEGHADLVASQDEDAATVKRHNDGLFCVIACII
jgi:hypothetical protein